MLHFVMRNMIFNHLNHTMSVTIECSWGLYRKPKFTQDLVNPYFLYPSINDATIFFFCSQHRVKICNKFIIGHAINVSRIKNSYDIAQKKILSMYQLTYVWVYLIPMNPNQMKSNECHHRIVTCHWIARLLRCY